MPKTRGPSARPNPWPGEGTRPFRMPSFLDALPDGQTHTPCWDYPHVFVTHRRTTPQIIAEEAKALCAKCPVRDLCLDYALTTGEDDGIWGGLTPRERDKLTSVTPVDPKES